MYIGSKVMHVVKNNVSSKSILIAEDDYSMRLVCRELLSGRGFEIHEAENGIKALRLFIKVKPNLIITDLNMPIMDGLNFIQNIRRMDSSIPIIAVSNDELLLEVALKNGANEIYSKKSDITNLVISVESLIGIR